MLAYYALGACIFMAWERTPYERVLALFLWWLYVPVLIVDGGVWLWRWMKGE